MKAISGKDFSEQDCAALKKHCVSESSDFWEGMPDTLTKKLLDDKLICIVWVA